LQGGEPRVVVNVENVHGHCELSWSPDGKKFAFTAGFGGDEELWLMENFLPEDKKK
jgi:Tol biopolymer transport system component